MVKNPILSIFGATGDLTKRKLLPALYHLEKQKQLSRSLKVFCIAKDNYSTEEFRVYASKHIKQVSKIKLDNKILKKLIKRIEYHQLRFQETPKYKSLKKLIEKTTNKKYNKLNNIFYLAAPPNFFGTITKNIKKSKLENNLTNVIFEKPFGYDLKSAKRLNKLITNVFEEKQIYRIDHYLAKELVQNILVLRFANTIFEHLWNRDHISHIQITVAEKLGVENRAVYYNNSGALRDILQNHMMQLLALIAMEPPKNMDATGIRNQKVKLLKSISKIQPQNVVRAQYSSGKIDGHKYPSYLNEKKIKKNSLIETFVALKLNINNGRWSGVPFYLRTGKRLKSQSSEIVITFNKLPISLFKNTNSKPNSLIIRVQPDEGISLQFNAKVPGKTLIIEPVSMDFCHSCKFGPNTPEAYERLLFDVLQGDSTLFTRWDEVEESWEICDPILKYWRNLKTIPKYKAGTWGPIQADKLLQKNKFKWTTPSKPLYSEWSKI